MSKVVDASAELGKLLLKGWVMTDNVCGTCANPLMRTPRNQEPPKVICVNCGEQNKAASTTQEAHPIVSSHSNRSSLSHGSDSLSLEGVSTPATDISTEPPASMVGTLETDELLRRRTQSDRASAEIGRRLLQGWAMLAEECPRPTCYGVPLVRPPRSGTVSKSRECVVCGTDYNPDIENESQTQQALSVPSTSKANAGRHEDAGSKSKSRIHVPVIAPSELPRDGLQPMGISNGNAFIASSTIISRTIDILATRLDTLSSRQPIPYAEMKMIAETMSALADAFQKMRQTTLNS